MGYYEGRAWYLEEQLQRIPRWLWRVVIFGLGFVVGLNW